MKKLYTSILKCIFCIFTVLAFLTLSKSTKAQTAATYVHAASSGTFSYLSSGTSVSSIVGDDVYSGAIPIGFTFNYCGTGYSNVYAGSNGWLSFSALTASFSFNSSGTLSNTLFPLWDDLDGGSGTGAATYLTSGVAPNRVFTMEWKNWQWNWSATGVTVSFQVKLYESTNVIQFIYIPESGTVNSPSATIGISGTTTTDYLTLNGTGTLPTASSSIFTTALTTRPASGQIYQFTPPLPTCTTPTVTTTVAAPSSLSCLGNSSTLSITPTPSGTGNTYQWQSSPDGIVAYTNITGATSSTAIVTPLSATWYRCVVTCANGPVSVNATPVQVTFSTTSPSVTPNVRCGTGTMSLAATGATGTTLRWYAAAFGGASLGSGSPFVTPIISATTNYFVGAELTSTGVGQIGSGSSLTTSFGYPTAFGNYWYQDWQQIVYTAAELNATGLVAGNITALAMNISGLPGPASVSGYNIRIASTLSTTLSTFTTSGLTNVFGPTTVTPASGWNTITFGTPYSWDGTSNIIVDIRGNGAYGSANATTFFTATSGNTCLSAYTSSSSAGAAFYTSSPTPTASTSRPNIRFSGNVVCSSPRVSVTATVNTPPTFSITGTQTICNNTRATMSVTSTLSSFNTYTWLPVTGLFTDTACTVAYISGASASTIYFKSASAGTTIYTCTANNSTTLCAATGTATITNLPSSVSVLATPANMCNSGSTTLAINPAVSTFGAGSWQWQSSADNTTFGDSSGATGATLTTNTLSFRRYYRIVLRNGAGSFCLNSASDTALVLIPAINSVTPAARCSTGTVTLGATATDGIINWYSAVTGGSSLATGTSYTTPSIALTTTYFVSAIASPNVTAAVGSGTVTNSSTSYPTPFGNYWGSSHDQYLITASELTAAGFSAGTLTSIAFDLASGYTSASLSNFQIQMAATSATALSTSLISTGFTTVVASTTYTPPSTSGYATIPFTTDFNWNGTSNIVVDVNFTNCSVCTGTTSCVTSYTNNGIVNQTSTSYVSAVSYYADGNCTISSFSPSGGLSSTASQRPNMRFVQRGCESARTSVTATVNTRPTVTATATPAVVCSGFTTTLTGGGTPTSTTYTWTGGVTNGVAFVPASTTRYIVTGTNPVGGCQDTAGVLVTVNPAPTVSSTPLGTYTVCADSGVMLRSTYTGTGLTFQWFNGTTAVPGGTNDSLYAGGATGGSGTYTLRVNLGSCSAQSTPGTTMNVNPLPTPSVSPTGPLNVCSAATTVLTGSGTGNYQWYNASGIISGATSSTYTVPATGVYTLLLTNPITGCRRSAPAVTVNVTPTPTITIAPVLSRVCIDSFATLTSVHSAGFGTGNTFQWFIGSTPIAGPAGTINNLTTTTSGVYTLRITNNGICSTTSNNATVIVNPLPASTFTKTGTTGAICLGSTFELTALIVPATSTYQWMLNGVDIPGATNRTYNAPTGGIYTVRITDSNNCRKISDTLSIINTPMGVPNLLPKDVRFCEGNDITLYSNAGPFSSTFKWTKDGGSLPDTTPNIVTGRSGTYDVTVKDVYGCVLTSPKVIITVDPLPTKPVIIKTGTELSTAAPYATYQWYRNGKIIAGANKRSHTLLFDGRYHVLVTNNANCNNVSDTVSIQNLAVKLITRNDIAVNIYPNPAQNMVNIDAPVPVNLFVKDIQGKQILELKDAKQVDMGVFADGVYIFTITDKDGLIIKMDKVVKRTN